MTLSINFFCQDTYFIKFQGHSASLTQKLKSYFKMPNNWSVTSDQVLKGVICTCADATEEFSFDLKIFLKKLC